MLMRDKAASYGGPRGGLLSRSHKMTTFLGFAVKMPSLFGTMSISDMEAGWSEARVGGIERRHWRKPVVVGLGGWRGV
ncbi:hypothetical protein HanIR_Chr09g0435011 [Helianthus annuus]|nr:hypothetical protein HanIR_Chr09g0435011 [Helianthus annuus]